MAAIASGHRHPDPAGSPWPPNSSVTLLHHAPAYDSHVAAPWVPWSPVSLGHAPSAVSVGPGWGVASGSSTRDVNAHHVAHAGGMPPGAHFMPHPMTGYAVMHGGPGSWHWAPGPQAAWGGRPGSDQAREGFWRPQAGTCTEELRYRSEGATSTTSHPALGSGTLTSAQVAPNPVLDPQAASAPGTHPASASASDFPPASGSGTCRSTPGPQAAAGDGGASVWRGRGLGAAWVPAHTQEVR